MGVSVIIPVYRPDKKFSRLLTMLAKQVDRPEKIIIMFSETPDHPMQEFKEQVASYFEQNPLLPDGASDKHNVNIDIIRVKKDEFDHGKTRHLGAVHAESEFILFMTEDAIPNDEWLITRLLKAMDDPQVAVAYARQNPRSRAKITEGFVRVFNYPSKSKVRTKENIEKDGIKGVFCSNSCAMYRRRTYLELGGFNYPILLGEDMLFAMKALLNGYKTTYCAEACVIHSHNYSPKAQFKRNFDIGAMHSMNKILFSELSAEKEGIKLLKKGNEFFISQKKYDAVVYFTFECGVKYLGYQLGRHYKMLPKKFILKCTTNRNYWLQNGI